MFKVPDFFRQIFLKPTPEEQRPKYVFGQPTPHKHYLVEEQQQTQSFVFPRGMPPGGWLNRSR
jgi:hypothetical protein